MCLFIALASSLYAAASPNKTGMFWGTAYNGPVRDPSYTKGSERGKKKGVVGVQINMGEIGAVWKSFAKDLGPSLFIVSINREIASEY